MEELSDSETQETVGIGLITLMKKLAKEEGIEIKDTEIGEPIPLYDWMLKEPETTTYNGQKLFKQ